MITIGLIQKVLLWCSIINMGLLLFSMLVIKAAHGLIYRIHGKWFNLSNEKLDSLLYLMLGVYKLGIFLFNIVPYIALRIITS